MFLWILLISLCMAGLLLSLSMLRFFLRWKRLTGMVLLMQSESRRVETRAADGQKLHIVLRLLGSIYKDYREAKSKPQRQDDRNSKPNSSDTCSNFDCGGTVTTSTNGESSNYCVGCAPIAVNVSDSNVLEF